MGGGVGGGIPHDEDEEGSAFRRGGGEALGGLYGDAPSV